MFLANLDRLFARTRSIFPSKQSLISLWNSSLFATLVPEIPLSAYTSTNTQDLLLCINLRVAAYCRVSTDEDDQPISSEDRGPSDVVEDELPPEDPEQTTSETDSPTETDKDFENEEIVAPTPEEPEQVLRKQR